MVMAWSASHGARHSKWYGLAGMAEYMVWPGGQGMVYIGNGIIYGMARRSWHGAMYMPWPGRHHMVYGMAWRTSHGIWYGLASSVMVCGKA